MDKLWMMAMVPASRIVLGGTGSPLGFLMMTVLAPCKSACTYRSSFCMYRRTICSFCCRSRPPITR